ncbi:Nramp family divalent metal transporter [Pseudonocardia abyssalis]|uniref:Nramp family divalent metal transporter n=1 Tax=Pseudonocardia abyssalis TaxID=2792008 RepID=A0ABS6UVT6_9PSEU|nr:Nramp family divalent metal transporter [Pseudonocardia abyssalis]MBW0135943.1 Nramp family divalent metal transporter [Pseudonocardia abyssalis]
MGTAEPGGYVTTSPPTGLGARLRQVGPGLLAAAAGVGAGDLVATMVAGSRYGTALLWAAVLGTALKLALAEGVGRWHLASGATLLDGWRRLGRWATTFFAVYIVIWGFVYGATAMSAVGLPLNALFGGLPVRYWAMIAGVVGLGLVWAQRYAVFEKFITVLVLIKFVSVVSVAALIGPDLGALATGLVPTLPDGSVVYVLGLIGGVGGTITMAAYGYWMIAKGWRGTGWLSVMRLDNAVGYVMTGIFVVAMLIIGAEILLGQDLASGDTGLLTLGSELGSRYGDWARVLFLVGFLAVTTTSLLGVWNGVSLLFADTVRTLRLPHGRDADVAAPDDAYEAGTAETSLPFRGYLLWLTIPPMGLLFFDQPFALTLVYGVLGAAFMPFLGGTLLILLNSRRFVTEGRSGWLSNLLVGAAAALFVVLLVVDLVTRFG